MPRYAYANGRFLPHNHARVHVEDRGYQFADGVYEVVPVHAGGVVDEEPHLDRLERSLGELRIDMPMSRPALKLVSHELIRRNALTNGFIYMQVTRGVAPRDHKFPKAKPRPALTMTTRQMAPKSQAQLDSGFAVITVPDQRWKRCDIKSISLLPNVLAKQQAAEAGCDEAWLIDADGNVTEGAATNAWIVTDDKKVITRQADSSILPGITRLSLTQVMARAGYELEIRPFSQEEAMTATEAFLTSSTNYVMPVTRIDGQPVGNGHPGLLTMQLRQAYIDEVVRGGRGAAPGDVDTAMAV
jgi:D-alanine transaminase